MRHLNYSHLFYFWNVAREGSIARAAQVLHLTPQTISGQLKLLEESVGEALFNRVGRGLVLTETGHIVNQYADEIFSLGAELSSRLKDKSSTNPMTLNVGIVNSIAKLIGFHVLAPALTMEDSFRILCFEGDLENLLADLAVHRLDIVLSDRPIPSGLAVKAYNHPLGTSKVGFFCQPALVSHYQQNFPRSLDNAPMLLPLSASPLRRQLDDWFAREEIMPSVVAEFDDSALMKIFGSSLNAVFPAPDAISDHIEKMYNVKQIGIASKVSENYYAISPERKMRHPAVAFIAHKARVDFLS